METYTDIQCNKKFFNISSGPLTDDQIQEVYDKFKIPKENIIDMKIPIDDSTDPYGLYESARDTIRDLTYHLSDIAYVEFGSIVGLYIVKELEYGGVHCLRSISENGKHEVFYPYPNLNSPHICQ